jgi:hypothetical protein
MHFNVGLADSTQGSLRTFEKMSTKDGEGIGSESLTGFTHSKSEPATHRLIRTCCKALHHLGNEQSGCSEKFNAFLRGQGCATNLLQVSQECIEYFSYSDM